MSPSWLDRLTLLVHPREVVLERQPWRGATLRQQATVAPAAAGEADWQPAVAAVAAVLAADGKRGGGLRIVVADHYVRYALLPWSDALAGGKGRRDMARALLRHTLGEQADGLEIALERPRFRRNGIAAGIDSRFLAALRAAAGSHRLRLHSLQPRLLAEVAANRQRLAAVDGWFACIDHGRVVLLGTRGGDVACLRNHRAATADPVALGAELSGLLAAEGGILNSRRVCLSSGGPTLPATLAGEWETTVWPLAFAGAKHG